MQGFVQRIISGGQTGADRADTIQPPILSGPSVALMPHGNTSAVGLFEYPAILPESLYQPAWLHVES
jgi:hypothetical protein